MENNHNITANDAAFTAICLLDDFTNNAQTAGAWEQLCTHYREDNGFCEWRDRLAEFAINVRSVYGELNAVYEDGLMEQLEGDFYDYDFHLVPYLTAQAAERGKIALDKEEITAIINLMPKHKVNQPIMSAATFIPDDVDGDNSKDVNDKEKVSLNDAAFTALCLLDDFTNNAQTAGAWEQLCTHYREQHGFCEWRDRVAEFAINIETAFNTVNASFNGVLMEILEDIDAYDFELVPYIANEAAALDKVTLEVEEITGIISKQIDRSKVQSVSEQDAQSGFRGVTPGQ